MQRLKTLTTILTCATALAACGGGSDNSATEIELAAEAPAVTFTPEDGAPASGKPQGPLTLDYRIIGNPVVGQPVAIELSVRSALGPEPVDVSYRILDATAMKLADAQPAKVTMAASTEEQRNSQRVTIVPLREGRLYLNVSLAVPSADGSMSTVTAIPVQVGSAPRQPDENGTAGTDEDGEAIRSLPADES